MKPQTYTISVQRRESNNSGRWREIATWQVITSEDDMAGPLQCGLRQNYRIVINLMESTSHATTQIPGPDSNHPRPGNPPSPTSGG